MCHRRFLSLHAVLEEIEEVLEDQILSKTREERFAAITEGCRDVLHDLQALVGKYESLGSKTKRTWDRFKWHSNDIAELRARLTSNTSLLTAFVSTSHIIVERQLNKFMHEYQEGKHESSVITTMTADPLSMDEKQLWRSIRKELEDIGVSIAAFDANRDFVMVWFQEAIRKGVFEEHAVGEDFDTNYFENDSPSSLVDLCTVTESFNAGRAPLDLDEEYVKVGEHKSLRIENLALAWPRTTSAQSTIIQELPTRIQNSNIVECKQDTPANERQITQRKNPRGLSIRINRIAGPWNNLSLASGSESALMSNSSTQAASLNTWSLWHEKVLLKAISMEDLLTVKKLVTEKSFRVESQDEFKLILISDAILTHKMEMVLLLLEHIDIHPVIGLHNALKLLRVAVQQGHFRLVNALLYRGVSPNQSYFFGETPLLHAVKNGEHEIAKLLLAKGAHPNVSDKHSLTPLLAAIDRRASETVQLLLLNGANPDLPHFSGLAPLTLAAFAGDKTILTLLLDYGAKVNSFSRQGQAALTGAALKGNESTVELLLRRYAWEKLWGFFKT